MSATGSSTGSVGAEGEAALERLEDALFEVAWLGQKQLAVELAPYDLTVPQFFTLLFAAANPAGATMSELAIQTRHSLATMTGIVERLVEAGLVRRGGKPEDRRVVLVELTEAGAQRVQEVRAARRRTLERAFHSLSPSDQRELIRLMRQFAAALGVHERSLPTRGGRTRPEA